jgi:glycerophosphoryl diester phosphodiesterase
MRKNPMLFCAVLATSPSFAQQQSLDVFSLRPPLVALHRGGIGGISSNTLERFKIALNQKPEIIEMDLRSTKDGVAVIFHDPELDQDTNCKGPVEQMLYKDLQNCKLSRSGHQIPTFEQAVQLINGKKIIDAEFKNIHVVEPALKVLKQMRAHSWVYFQTKSDPEIFLRARSIDDDVALLFKADDKQDLDWALNLRDSRLIIIEFDEKMMSPENLRVVRKAGKLIRANAWKFDPTKELFTANCKELFRWGVSIAHTNKGNSCFDQKRFYREP